MKPSIAFCVIAMLITPGSTEAQYEDARVFMAVDGTQESAPATGSTHLFMEAGSTARVAVWVEQIGGTVLFHGQQLIWQWFATPLEGQGHEDVVYVDNDPGQGGGDSVFVDTQRSDFVLFGQPLDGVTGSFVIYGETPPELNEFPVFACIVLAEVGQEYDISDQGIQYLGEFEIRAEPAALGLYEFRFNVPPSGAPLAALFQASGAPWEVDWQFLTVEVVPPGICGNGILNPPEGCDDANAIDGDGCSSECQRETHYVCTGEPSVCVFEEPAVPVTSAGGQALLVVLLVSGLAGIAVRRTLA